VTRLIEDLWLKDGMAISAAVMGGFTDLPTVCIHRLNRLFYGHTYTFKYVKNRYLRQMLSADLPAGGNEL
jgi:hypothetical protein